MIYYGVETTFQAIEAQSIAVPQVTEVPTTGLYCAQIITPEIATRGYFDARTDFVACFNSDAEAIQQRHENVPIIEQFAPPASEVPPFLQTTGAASQKSLDQSQPELAAFQSGCSTQNRATLFYYVGYSGNGPDVCATATGAYIGGVTMKSVWLVGGSCAGVNVTMNKYPWPNVQYVDFSSSAYQFLYVTRYDWSPPC